MIQRQQQILHNSCKLKSYGQEVAQMSRAAEWCSVRLALVFQTITPVSKKFQFRICGIKEISDFVQVVLFEGNNGIYVRVSHNGIYVSQRCQIYLPFKSDMCQN